MRSSKSPYSLETGSNCLLPGSGTVPHVVKQTHRIDNQRLIDAVRLCRQTLEEAVVLLENKITHRNQVLVVLTDIADRQMQLIHLLSPVRIDSLDAVLNEDDRAQQYNDYFGIREVADMDVLEFAKVDAHVTHAILLELIDTSLDEFELANLMRSVLLRWTFIDDALSANSTRQDMHSIDENEHVEPATRDTNKRNDPVLISFHRWRISHHAFALDALYAHFFLACALKELDTQSVSKAAVAIQKAGVALRATTVSMLLASKMPKAIYNDHVRPSMGLGFSGNDNRWWNQLVQTVRIVIEKAKALNASALNQALLDFHEKYLQDIELHTWVASKLVGSRPSLTLEEINSYGDETQRSERFATADLRSLHYIRQHEFSFLHYYPILSQLFTVKN